MALNSCVRQAQLTTSSMLSTTSSSGSGSGNSDAPASEKADSGPKEDTPNRQQEPQKKQPQEGRRGAAVDTSSSGRGGVHLGLDDPSLNMYLSYNTTFKTDEERLYRVGMVAAMDRKGRTELRKALAAHRLALQDAAAGPAALRGPSSLVDRMSARLAEIEATMRAPPV